MHIPDGFLSTPVWATLDLVALPAVTLLARRAQREFDHNKIPLMGVMGAFIFAAQMINFPVGNGTSGHLVGGTLLAITLGPAAASIVMTAILATQALVFQDGGLLALGANVFNMAIAGVFAGYVPWLLLRRTRAGVFAGGFCSLLVSAGLALVELLQSGVAMPRPVLVLSIGLFAVSALIEGAITVAVAQALEKIQPGFARRPSRASLRSQQALAGGALMLAVGGILVASTRPDGVEALSLQLGISSQVTSFFTTPFSDYRIATLSSPWLGKALAGVVGLAVVYLLCVTITRLLGHRESMRESVRDSA